LLNGQVELCGQYADADVEVTLLADPIQCLGCLQPGAEGKVGVGHDAGGRGFERAGQLFVVSVERVWCRRVQIDAEHWPTVLEDGQRQAAGHPACRARTRVGEPALLVEEVSNLLLDDLARFDAFLARPTIDVLREIDGGDLVVRGHESESHAVLHHRQAQPYKLRDDLPRDPAELKQFVASIGVTEAEVLVQCGIGLGDGFHR
jgi:hypothetical protein